MKTPTTRRISLASLLLVPALVAGCASDAEGPSTASTSGGRGGTDTGGSGGTNATAGGPQGGTAGGKSTGGTGGTGGTTSAGAGGTTTGGAGAGAAEAGGAGGTGGGIAGAGDGGSTSGAGGGAGEDGTGGASAGTSGGGSDGAGTSGTGGMNVGGAGGAGTGGASGSGTAGNASGAGGAAGSSAGAGGGSAGSNACPLDLIGFATLGGGTTGGGDATPTVVTTQAELRACATASGARVCRVQGTLTFNPFEEIRVTSNKTIIGIGANAAIVMGGFFLAEGVENVIIRNLTIRDSYVDGQDEAGGDEGGDRDGVQMDTASRVWIDHCRFRRLGDGLIDSRKDTTFETVSWNILENHNKAFGIGWTDNVTSEITIHHNWIHDTTQRNPSTDNVLRAHLFNNLLENVSSYGNYARGGTNMVLEHSVFLNVNDPYYYDTGTLVAIDNIVEDSSGDREASGSTFSFFDPSDFYSYTLTPVSQVEDLVRRCAGPRAELGN